ncbi:MAG: hypothetical protein KJ593_03695 [Candidatus Omnitrophica bacterium]|nr:hypothetical protein [Candidatus Omnitrophota bacterium]
MIEKVRKLFLWMIVILLISNSFGCDAFRRKITRKNKKEIIEPVLRPEEDAGLFYDNETRYRNYFAYWRGWHDELIQAIPGKSKKRKKYSFGQTMDNLYLMQDLLREGEKKKELTEYMDKLEKIQRQIDTNQAFNERTLIQQLSSIRLAINKKLHYSKVKDWIKE